MKLYSLKKNFYCIHLLEFVFFLKAESHKNSRKQKYKH